MMEGNLPVAELADRGIFATRQFAKRQLTWLRALREAGTIDHEFGLESALDGTEATDKILAEIDTHLEPAASPEA